MKKKPIKRLISALLTITIACCGIFANSQICHAAGYLDGDLSFTTSVSSSSLKPNVEYASTFTSFSQGGIIKFSLSGASTVEKIEIQGGKYKNGSYEVLLTATNSNGYNNCYFTADLEKGTAYRLVFYTSSKSSSQKFTCSASLYEESYTSTSSGCTWYPSNQKNIPSKIQYLSIQYFPPEQLALLYAYQDVSIRNKLLDGTYSVLTTVSLSYALQGAPAVAKMFEKIGSNKIVKAASVIFGTTSISEIFGGSMITELEKSIILEKSNNLTRGLILKNYFYLGRSYNTYEAWDDCPTAISPAGWNGTWVEGVGISLE